MFLKTFFTTFGLIFLAELGDKTQLATMSIASRNKTFLPIFLGATLALIVSSLLAASLGVMINQHIPRYYINIISGVIFIIIGIWILFDIA